MRILVSLVALCAVVSAFPSELLSQQTPSTGPQPTATVRQDATPAGPVTAPLPAATPTFWESVHAHRRLLTVSAILAVAIVIGGVVLLYRAFRADTNPLILRLGPSFFFWLGMLYTALLLLLAAVYNLAFPSPRVRLLGGILPVGVPWFGALGAVAISLEGVFLWNNQWDRKYNYWHIGRPLFGSVLGIVAFFIFVVIGAAAGTPPKFLDIGSSPAPLKDFIIYYVIAFLVGYREETFRELIKRATDLILKPGTQAAPAPAVTFKVAGTTAQEIRCPDVAAGQPPSRVTVEVQNTGAAALTAPVVTVTPVDPTPANTFATANDQVTGGGDLAPGQTRRLDVTFSPQVAGNFSGMLTITATNLSVPKTIRISGHRP
jgi:hypothetical protein